MPKSNQVFVLTEDNKPAGVTISPIAAENWLGTPDSDYQTFFLKGKPTAGQKVFVLMEGEVPMAVTPSKTKAEEWISRPDTDYIAYNLDVSEPGRVAPSEEHGKTPQEHLTRNVNQLENRLNELETALKQMEELKKRFKFKSSLLVKSYEFPVTKKQEQARERRARIADYLRANPYEKLKDVAAKFDVSFALVKQISNQEGIYRENLPPELRAKQTEPCPKCGEPKSKPSRVCRTCLLKEHYNTKGQAVVDALLAGKGWNAIVSEIHVSNSFVSEIAAYLREQGFTLHQPGAAKGEVRRPRQFDYEAIIKYIDEHPELTREQIARTFNCSVNTIDKIRRKKQNDRPREHDE